MHDQIKKILERIKEQDFDNVENFGVLITKEFFKQNLAALWYYDHSIFFLAREDKDSCLPLLLIELCNTLQNFEKQNLIYVEHVKEPQEKLFYENVDNVTYQKALVAYQLDTGELLQDTNKGWCILKNGKDIISQKNMLSGPIVDQIIRFLIARIYPCESLKSFVKDGFKSRNDVIAARSLRAAWISVGVAFFVAIFSPLLTVHVSNQMGHTKIDSCQFEILKEKTIIKDTIVINNHYNILNDKLKQLNK